MEITTICQSANVLGESPFWHVARQSVFWVDIEECAIHELKLDNDYNQSWNIGKRVSVILKADDDGLFIGVQGGIMKFNLINGNTELVVPVDGDQPTHRCNDGAIDSKGRIWVGVMEVHGKKNAGGLFRIEGQSVAKVIENVTIPNGLVWSLDNKIMYFTDTLNRSIKAYNFDDNTGDIKFIKDAIRIPQHMGMPDGLTIDAEGMLWVALYGGAGLSRWNPESGKMLQFIELPALNITNCCFVGEQFKDLLVTSATENLNDEQMAEYPESGNLFLIKNLDISGVNQ